MSAITPTCLPWQTKHDFDIEGRTTIIGNVDGEIIDGTTHHSFDFVCATLDHMDDSQSQSVAVANAEFIVRACSSHAKLVAALIESKRAMWIEARINWTMADFKNWAVIQQIDAALEKADGKPRTAEAIALASQVPA